MEVSFFIFKNRWGGAYYIYNLNVFIMADIQKLNVNNTTYDISTTWTKVTGKPNYYEFSTQRDFGSGTLIKTNINYDEIGDPFYGEIKGNTYGEAPNSCFTQFQGYIYIIIP